ncbi:MAG: S-methyl-5'-thioadenosine phosphorylase [Bacteroidota bacterium]
MTRLGIIGGSGLEKLQLFKDVKEIHVKTPYGDPSSSFFVGHIADKEVYILSRHDRNHEIPPSQVNNLANISAFQQLGCEAIIASTACGSLREHIHPGELIIPDQFIDFTRHREITFHKEFKDGNVIHISMADPFSDYVRKKIQEAAAQADMFIHTTGTVVTIEGPRLSTRAESKMFRIWGADIINMSIAVECTLAEELNIPYAAIAMCTDYDSWRESEEGVTWDDIIKTFHANAEKVTHLLEKVIPLI